jgi:solute carrier family 25 phosphate transporter 3
MDQVYDIRVGRRSEREYRHRELPLSSPESSRSSYTIEHVHSTTVTLPHSSLTGRWNARWAHEIPHDNAYYSKCLAGGVLSSSIRWVLTPLDSIKTNMQANPNKFPYLSSGLRTVYAEEGVRGLYRGLGATVLSYSFQSGTKYFLYEILKDQFSTLAGEDHAHAYRDLIYVTAAGCAEACADVFMCPWEMTKVKVQTSAPGTFPVAFGPSLVAMMHNRRDLRFPFGSLGPLIGRQLPGTIANFYTFEKVVEKLYTHVLTQPKDSYSKPAQLSVTLIAGYVSGSVAAVISHPADSLISLMAKPKYQNHTIQEIIRDVGLLKLATKGLGPRIAMTGTIISFQWWIYDTFKTVMGMGTTGGKS